MLRPVGLLRGMESRRADLLGMEILHGPLHPGKEILHDFLPLETENRHAVLHLGMESYLAVHHHHESGGYLESPLHEVEIDYVVFDETVQSMSQELYQSR